MKAKYITGLGVLEGCRKPKKLKAYQERRESSKAVADYHATLAPPSLKELRKAKREASASRYETIAKARKEREQKREMAKFAR